MIGRAAILALLFALGAIPAAAQAFLPTSPVRTPAVEPPATPATETTPDAHVDALIEALRDEAARDRLIEALQQSRPVDPPNVTTSAESVGRVNLPASPDDATEPTPVVGPSIGDRVLDAVPSLFEEFVTDARADWRQLLATIRRLGGLGRIDPGPALEMIKGTAAMLALTLSVVFAGRLLLLPVYRRIAALAKGAVITRRLALGALTVLLEVAVLGLATCSIVLLIPRGDAIEPSENYRVYFLVAFFLSGLLAIAVRAALSPATSELRPLPISDRPARYWSVHLSIVFAILTFGEIFFDEATRQLAGPITANAVTIIVHVAGIIYLGALFVLNRKEPSAFVGRLAAASPENPFLPLAASALRYWLWPAFALLGILMNGAISTADTALSVIGGAFVILLTLAGAVYVIAVLNRLAKAGVSLPESVTRIAPEMGDRLNAFIPGFLRVLGYVVFFIWAGFTVRMLGVSGPRDWIEGHFGFDTASVIISLMIIVLVGYAVWLVTSSWIDYRLSPVDGHPPTARTRTLFSLLRNAILVAILVLGLTSALSSFGISVAPLLASAGVVGLAIGFGSQKLVQDIINGLFIQFENAINVGDVVEVGGRIGAVEKLTIRSVSLRDVEGVMHIIPFSSVDSVSNYMKGFSYHVADISIAYDADIDTAKEAMLAAYDDLAQDFEWSTRLLGGIEWFGVQTLGDSAVVLRARLKTRAGEQWGVGRAYAERVKRRFDAAGVEIPFPQMKLWFDGQRAEPAPLGPPAPPRTATGPTDADDDGGDGR